MNDMVIKSEAAPNNEFLSGNEDCDDQNLAFPSGALRIKTSTLSIRAIVEHSQCDGADCNPVCSHLISVNCKLLLTIMRFVKHMLFVCLSTQCQC